MKYLGLLLTAAIIGAVMTCLVVVPCDGTVTTNHDCAIAASHGLVVESGEPTLAPPLPLHREAPSQVLYVSVEADTAMPGR